MLGLVFQVRGLNSFHLRLHSFNPSSGLVNYGEWAEEIRAWVWESLGPALLLWQPELGSFFPPPLSHSSLGGRPGFFVPLLPSGGHQKKDRLKGGHSGTLGLWEQKGAEKKPRFVGGGMNFYDENTLCMWTKMS